MRDGICTFRGVAQGWRWAAAYSAGPCGRVFDRESVGMSKKPVVIELDASEPVPTPVEAPIVTSEASAPALEHGLRFAAGR
jgi:hypothetical protein